MDKEAFVPMQAVLLSVAFAATLAWCGERAAGAVVLVAGIGCLIWLVLAARFHLKSRTGGTADGQSPGDREVVLYSLAALVLPFGVALALWAGDLEFGFASVTGTWVAVAVCVILAAIYLSSLVDRYFILPYVYGRFASPVWVEDAPPEPAADPPAEEESERTLSLKRRRMYAKLWVAHRTACEIIVFVGLALILSVLLIEIIDAVTFNETLPRAIESIGGAGIAVAVLGYVGPRARDGISFVLGGHAGLGAWVKGFDTYQREVEGYVVSVSVEPGVKVMTREHEFRYLPLGNQRSFHDSLGDEWEKAGATGEIEEGAGERWRHRAQLEEHSEKTKKRKKRWRFRLPRP